MKDWFATQDFFHVVNTLHGLSFSMKPFLVSRHVSCRVVRKLTSAHPWFSHLLVPGITDKLKKKGNGYELNLTSRNWPIIGACLGNKQMPYKVEVWVICQSRRLCQTQILSLYMKRRSNAYKNVFVQIKFCMRKTHGKNFAFEKLF